MNFRSASQSRAPASSAVQFAIVTMAAVLILWQLSAMLISLRPFTSFGFSLNPDRTVVCLQIHCAGAAPVQAGDRLDSDAQTMTFIRQLNDWNQFKHSSYSITVIRRDERLRFRIVGHDTTSFRLRGLPNALLIWAAGIAGSVALAFSAWLLCVYPGWMILSLALGILGTGIMYWVVPPEPLMLRHWLKVVGAIVFGSGWWPALLIFASRFPEDRVAGWRIAAERFSFGALLVSEGAVCVAALYYAVTWRSISWILDLDPHGTNSSRAPNVFLVVQSVVVLTAACILAIRYRSAENIVQSRIAWVIPALLSSALTIALGGFNVGMVIVPVSVYYALRHAGLLNVRFAVPRFVAATLYCIAAILPPSLLEQSVPTFFPKQIHLVTTVVVAVVAYVTWKPVENYIERWMNKRKTEAADQLDRFGTEMHLAEGRQFVFDALAVKAPVAMELCSAAVFARDRRANRYRRVAETAWHSGCCKELRHDDDLILSLLSKQSPRRINAAELGRSDLPPFFLAPVLAIPISLGGDVLAIALYGQHTDGCRIDRDEERLLRSLSLHAASALKRIGEPK